jgi:hypothetical protein
MLWARRDDKLLFSASCLSKEVQGVGVGVGMLFEVNTNGSDNVTGTDVSCFNNDNH